MKNRRIIIPVKHNAERRIIIEKDERGIRAALTLDGVPAEFSEQVGERESCVGNIYAARVESVSKSGFAFINIGQERNAFLNLNDNKNSHFTNMLKPGRTVTVQITRDAYKEKGAYATAKISWPGRFFVIEHIYQDEQAGISVSKKIVSEGERQRLIRITERCLENNPLSGKAIIIRTDAENAASSFLETEFNSLVSVVKQSEELLAFADNADLPLLVYKPFSSSCMKMASDLAGGAGGDVKEIVINDENLRKELEAAYSSRNIKAVFAENPFALYNLSKVYDSTKHRLVYLNSGGHIVIDRTEACVVIDVNSGQYTGRMNMEDMALKINIEAAKEAARQLRLRNLGGIIIIDFISMKEPESILTLTKELSDALAEDPAITVVEGMTRLGLMEMTRKRR